MSVMKKMKEHFPQFFPGDSGELDPNIINKGTAMNADARSFFTNVASSFKSLTEWVTTQIATLTGQIGDKASKLELSAHTTVINGTAHGINTLIGEHNAAISHAAGIAGSAPFLTTERHINLSDDLTGSAKFNGSKDITIQAILKNTGAASNYRSVTTDAQGRVVSGTLPNTLAGYDLATTVYTKLETDAVIDADIVIHNGSNLAHANGISGRSAGADVADKLKTPFKIQLKGDLWGLSDPIDGSDPLVEIVGYSNIDYAWSPNMADTEFGDIVMPSDRYAMIWVAGTVFRVGDYLKDASNSAFHFRCEFGGTASGAEPNWAIHITANELWTDANGIQWRTLAGAIYSRFSYRSVCSVAGTGICGATEPDWGVFANLETECTDGGVKWHCFSTALATHAVTADMAEKWTEPMTLIFNGADVTGSVAFDGGSSPVTVALDVKHSDNSDKWLDGKTINLTGDIVGTSAKFDGSENLSFATTLKNTGTASTYRSVTTDAQGRVVSGTNPTTIAGYLISDAYTKAETEKIIDDDVAVVAGNLTTHVNKSGSATDAHGIAGIVTAINGVINNKADATALTTHTGQTTGAHNLAALLEEKLGTGDRAASAAAVHGTTTIPIYINTGGTLPSFILHCNRSDQNRMMVIQNESCWNEVAIGGTPEGARPGGLYPCTNGSGGFTWAGITIGEPLLAAHAASTNTAHGIQETVEFIMTEVYGRVANVTYNAHTADNTAHNLTATIATLNTAINGKTSSGAFRGMLCAFHVAPTDANWKYCDGGNGTPDLRGYFLFGANGAHPVGYGVGGEESHTLGLTEITSHQHKTDTDSVTLKGGSSSGDQKGALINSYAYDRVQEIVGGGLAHNNMPPYYCANFYCYLPPLSVEDEVAEEIDDTEDEKKRKVLRILKWLDKSENKKILERMV